MQDSNLYIYPDDFTAVVKSEDANTLYTTRKFSYSPNSKIKKDDYFNHLDKKKNTSNDGDDDFGRLIDSKGQILNIYSNEETSPNEGGLNKNMTFLKDCVYSFKKYAQICHKPCFFANTSLFDYNSRSKIKLIDISFDEDLDVKMDIQLSLSQKKQLYIKIGSQYLSGYIFDSNEYPNIVVSDGSFIEQENYQDDINLILNFISMNIITLEYTNFDLMKKVCSLLKLNEPFDIIARIYNNFKTNFQRIDYLGKVEEEILEIFDNIDHKNIDSHAEKLIMKIADMILANYTSKQIYIHFICSFLYTISYSRPLKNDILVKLIDILIKILPEGFQTQFNELLLSKLGMTDNFNFYFLHELMKHGIIPLDKILETISSHFSIKAAFWFFPYSENSTDYKYFSEDLEDRINFSLENETKSAMYKKLFNELRKDDYKLHKEYTKMGHSPDPLLKCIRDDDLETFQTYSTNISFDFGMLIFNDIFERSSFLCYRPNLLQYSAYFGSVKVFKYLFLQKVNKEYIDANGKNLLDYIIAGSCNAEILHIVDEIPDIYTNYAPITATTFHRYPIYEWLLGKYYSTNISQQEKIISKKSLILCYLESITSLNYPIFMNLMMDSQIRNEVVTLISLHTAIQSNNIEVTMFFSDLKNYEESASTLLSSAFGTTSDQSLFKFVKSKFVGNNSFAYHPTLLESIKNDNLHVFQYIIENYILKSQESQKEKDIYDHVSAINEVNPFVTACKCGALKIVKYLMKLPGFSILPLIKHSILRKLTKRKFFMIVREILSIPNISIAEFVPENKNCFTAACWMNFAHIAKFIYNKCKTDDGKNLIDVNKNGNRQETPLTGCACINNVDMGTFILSLPETDINLPNKLHSQTAITCALNKGKVEFARLLLKHDNLIFDLNKALEKCLKIGSVNLVKDVLNHPNADFSEIDFFFDKAIDILLDIDVNVLIEIFRCKRINKTQDEINKIAYRFARSDIYRLYFDINNLPHYDDCIPLFEAIDINCEECVRYLLTNVPNLDVNERNQENDTPLFLAVKHRKEKIIQALVEDPRVDINPINNEKITPYYYAVLDKLPKKVIELLVETNRVNYNFDFRINISVIERIFKLKKSEVLEQYIQSITNDKDSLINALNFSIIYQKPKVFDNLIQNPLIEVQDALITAIMNHQNENIIKMLLEHPTFDINFISKDGKTALIAAVLQKSVKITNNILNYSSNNKETNVDLVVNNEVSALSCCLTLETFRLLKEKGAKEINRFNCDGKTILYSAIESNNYQLFDHIIFLPELDVNKPNKDGNVPLFAAGLNTSFHYTEKLLERQDLILNENECNYGIISGALKQKNYQCCLNLLKRGVQCDNDSLVTILKNATDKSDVSNFIPQKINPFINFAGIPNQFLDKVLERIDLTLPQPNKGYNVHIMYQFIDYEKIDLFQKFFNILITSDSESIRNMINWQKQSNGNTFLIYSCKKKFDPAIKLMLDCSPNINLNVDIKNKHGKNCLQFLVNNKQFDFVPKVIEKSKDYQIVNEIFSNQETLLNSLIINNQTNLFKTITTHYKDTVKVDLRGKFQMLPIEHAIVRNHFEIAEFILNTFPDSDIGNSLQLCLLRPNMMNLFLNKKKEEIIERMKNDPKYRDLFFNRLEFHKDEQINNIVNDCAEIQRLR